MSDQTRPLGINVADGVGTIERIGKSGSENVEANAIAVGSVDEAGAFKVIRLVFLQPDRGSVVFKSGKLYTLNYKLDLR